jgi:hypothetical protein
MNVPRTAILSIGAAIVCALGLGSALVPGHSLDEVRQDGQVQIAGEVSSEPGQVLADGERCAAIATMGRPPTLSLPFLDPVSKLRTCSGSWPALTFTDLKGAQLKLTPTMATVLAEKLANGSHGLVFGAAALCSAHSSGLEACIPQRLPVVVRACRAGEVLSDCDDGSEDAWQYSDVPLFKRVVDRRRLGRAASVIVVLAGLVAGVLPLLRRRGARAPESQGGVPTAKGGRHGVGMRGDSRGQFPRVSGAAPRAVIVSVAAAIVCALGFTSALVPGRTLDRVSSSGPVQVAGEVSSEPGDRLANGSQCAAMRPMGWPGEEALLHSFHRRLTTCDSGGWPWLTFADAKGVQATLEPMMVELLGEKLAKEGDGAFRGAPVRCPMFSASSAFEACIPQRLRVVVRACRSGAELVPCPDRSEDAWRYSEVPFFKRVVDFRRLAWAGGVIVLVAGLAAGALRLLERRRA